MTRQMKTFFREADAMTETDCNETLYSWLRGNDVRLFAEHLRLQEARDEFNRVNNASVSAKVFRKAVAECCRYYKAGYRRRRKPRNTSLTSSHWDRLKSVVVEMLSELQGLPAEHAAELVRTRISCSVFTLNGLPARLRVWNK